MIFSLFVVLLSFRSSLACDQIKCLFLNYEPCMVRPTLFGMNTVEFKYYPLMISVNKCTGSCNVLSPKAKAMKERISCDCKCKFNSTI